MDEHGVAHVADDELAEIEGKEDPVAEGDLCEGGEGREDAGAEEDAVEMAVGYGAIDDGTENVGEERKLDAADGGEDEKEEDDAAMRTGVAEDAAHETEELKGLEFDVALFVGGDVG
jgi:hypothetical protein